MVGGGHTHSHYSVVSCTHTATHADDSDARKERVGEKEIIISVCVQQWQTVSQARGPERTRERQHWPSRADTGAPTGK